jgi:hypothetical protein
MRLFVPMTCALISLSGCGGTAQGPANPSPSATPPVAETVEAPATDETKPNETPSSDAEPKNDAPKYLKILEQDGVDGGHRGRIAASSLSEAQFGLSAQMKKTLEFLSSEQVDPLQTSRIIAELINEEPGASDTVKAACQKEWKLLRTELEKVEFEKRTPRLLAECKIPPALLFGKAPEKINFSSLLLALVVEKSLEARGSISKAERGIAAHLGELHPLDEPGWK